MANRAKDWLQQAERDLELAKMAAQAERFEGACFAAHQAAGKAVEAVHLAWGQEPWGHVVARLIIELPDYAMPVRSLNSRVMKWPSRDEVIRSAEIWARNLAESHPQVRAVACFGSYARGDHGVGSDLDLFVVIEDHVEQPELRSLGWGQERLPVSAEVIVYTLDEWQRAGDEKRRFYQMIEREAMWLWTDPAFRS